VSADGATWWEPPLASLWARPPSSPLRFLDATVAGAGGDGVLLVIPDGELLAVAAHDSPELAYVDNLRLLARARGAPVRLVARPVGRRRLAPVALGAPWLPSAYRGHVDLGLDRLRRADLPVDAPGPVRPWQLPDDALPLQALRRRVERAVEGGRGAVPGDARELSRLSSLLPAAGELAGRLEAASRPHRDALGRATAAGTEDFARAWLAAATYVHEAQRSADHDDWLRVLPATEPV
jgi:hypothetical protein